MYYPDLSPLIRFATGLALGVVLGLAVVAAMAVS